MEIVLATPLSGAFTKPTASRLLGSMLADRDIRLEPDFMVERIDQNRQALVSYDEREVPFDLMVTVPLNLGSDFVGGSGLGDALNYVAVDRHTFRSTAHAIPRVGPFTLLSESRVNHWGKVGFRWFYWNVLLPGRSLPGALGRALSAPVGPVPTTVEGGTPCP